MCAHASGARWQRGLTMVELLVALVISLFIALAAVAALTVARQGFTTVDAASQLRDNGRFTADLLQRLGVQTGFKDVWYASRPPTAQESAADLPPNIMGFNNSLVDASSPLTAATARTTGVVGYGSDVLIMRSQLVQLNAESTVADGSMIDCNGSSLVASGSASSTRGERAASILSVAVSNGEPSLMCTTVNSGGTIASAQPIIEGVENFQVLYGTEGVAAATAPPVTYGFTANAPAPASSAEWVTWAASINQVPNRYFRADQLTVSGNTVATNANWRRVRSLRIGMVLRGAPNSAQSTGTQTLYPFGSAKSGATGTAGSALSSANDVNTIFVAPADGRLRQVVTFTVHLRNSQGL
ncbi:MAG: PilW family protein [Rhodoferax sp.]|nr:PilW family protein [Rhodoferax sp.]